MTPTNIETLKATAVGKLEAIRDCDTADRAFSYGVCSPYVMYRVGKKRAGRLLDGKLHDAMPEAAHD